MPADLSAGPDDTPGPAHLPSQARLHAVGLAGLAMAATAGGLSAATPRPVTILLVAAAAAVLSHAAPLRQVGPAVAAAAGAAVAIGVFGFVAGFVTVIA